MSRTIPPRTVLPHRLLLFVLATTTWCPAGEPRLQPPEGAVEQVASAAGSEPSSERAAELPPQVSLIPPRPEEADLAAILAYARAVHRRIAEEVQDYTCVLARRERVNAREPEWQFMQVKIRNEQREDGELTVPFSVYVKFLLGEDLAGREVLYVENRFQGDLWARRGGRRSPNMTLRLMPTSPLAMEGNRYPVTEIGFLNLAVRLIEVMEQEAQYNDAEVRVYLDAKVDDRSCTRYALSHDQRRPNLTYQSAEVWMHNETGLPIAYRAFDWPAKEGGEPILLEEYVYRNIKLNVGLTDEDFDRRNPAYHFRIRESDDDDDDAQESPGTAPADDDGAGDGELSAVPRTRGVGPRS